MALFLGAVKTLGGEAKYAAVSFGKVISEKQRGVRDKLRTRTIRWKKLPEGPLEFSLYDKAGRRMAVCIEIELEVPTTLKPYRLKEVSLYDLHMNMLLTDRLMYII